MRVRYLTTEGALVLYRSCDMAPVVVTEGWAHQHPRATRRLWQRLFTAKSGEVARRLKGRQRRAHKARGALMDHIVRPARPTKESTRGL